MIRLKLHRGQWFRCTGRFKTGSVDYRTGAHVPYIRDGKEWPAEVDIWIGPFKKYGAALRSAMPVK